MSAVMKSRSEMIADLIDYEVGIIKSMGLDDVDSWIATVLERGYRGYDDFTDMELVTMYVQFLNETKGDENV